jgi:hypothetical protein
MRRHDEKRQLRSLFEFHLKLLLDFFLGSDVFILVF